MPEPTPIRGDEAAAVPEPPDEAVYHGLAGEIVRAIAPNTEADPVGILVSLLAGVGNAIGPGPFLILDHLPHGLRVWPVLVGPTGTGRKGTALAAAGSLLSRALPVWWGRQASGLASGEGLIYHVRDATTDRVAVKEKGGAVPRYEEVVTDAGVEDKRLFVVETEFGSVLQQVGREKSTLSAVIRNAWDGKQLASMVKNSPTKATGAHVTITGHITAEEVRELLADRDVKNGFANRFLWVCVRRARILPLGADEDADRLDALGSVLRETIAEATAFGRLRLDADGEAAWVRVYEGLTSDAPGVVGHLSSRAAPTVMRLAGIYAALDATAHIGRAHLAAALALWGYADLSIRHIFGGSAASPRRRTILAALAGGTMTATDINGDVFGRNIAAHEIQEALEALLRDGLVTQTWQRATSGRGRPAQVWTLTDKGRLEVRP